MASYIDRLMASINKLDKPESIEDTTVCFPESRKPSINLLVLLIFLSFGHQNGAYRRYQIRARSSERVLGKVKSYCFEQWLAAPLR